VSGKLRTSITTHNPIPELALLSASVRACTSTAVAVVTQYVTQVSWGVETGMLGSMETPEHERREIVEYLRSQSGPDFEIEHVEKLTSEYVMGNEYSVWDAHTNEGRWWVITNPANLYSQEQIKVWM
jgi:hypothetical protein